MTLSLRAENRTVNMEHVDVLAHHDEYDKPETGCTLRIGLISVHLDGEQTVRLGTFLAGGHAALEAKS